MNRTISRTPIRAFGGKIVAWLESDKEGNQRLTEFGGRIIATYDVKTNKSREFGGRIIGEGNMIAGLAFDPKRNPSAKSLK